MVLDNSLTYNCELSMLSGWSSAATHTVFQNLVKMLQVLHDDISVFFQYRQGDEKVVVAAQPVGPQCFPQAKHIRPFELALVPDEEHSEKEEKVGGVSRLKMKIEGGIHELNKMVEGQKLLAHA